VSLFSACSHRELLAIAAHTREIRVPSGTDLTVEGESGDEFYVLAEGLAWATVGGERVGSIRPGSCFGEMALLDGRERAATVTTQLPSRLLVLGRGGFHSLIRGYPGVTEKVLRILAERLRAVECDRRWFPLAGLDWRP
jgi:CRP/FNR family transcriptional regulator, cyclic AMP receptor protein